MEAGERTLCAVFLLGGVINLALAVFAFAVSPGFWWVLANASIGVTLLGMAAIFFVRWRD